MAKKSKGNKRQLLLFTCSECKKNNYISEKNKINTPDKLELNKYCKFCKKHTAHKEKAKLK
jgi:large subunit ribosomal protein L33